MNHSPAETGRLNAVFSSFLDWRMPMPGGGTLTAKHGAGIRTGE